MKCKTGFFMLLLVALPLAVGSFASAQQTQTVSTVNLAYMTVQLSYPTILQPSQSAAVSVQAISRDNVVVDELTLQIYVPTQSSLRQIATAAIAKGVAMRTGSQVTDNINFTVPSDAPRTPLMAVVTENLRLLTSAYWDRYADPSRYAVQNTTYPYAYYIPKTPEGVESNDLSFTPLSYIDAPSSSGTLDLAQQGSTSNTVNMDFMTVQLSYPAMLQPGQTATLGAQAVSNYDFELDNLALQIFITDQNNLKQIATGSIARGVIMTTGSEVRADLNFTVPTDAPASSLLAVVTEDVRLPTYPGAYYYYGYNGESAHQNSTYPYNYRMSPAPVGTQANDISYTALSYVNAPNPTSPASSQTVTQLVQSQTQNQSLIQNLQQNVNANQNSASQPSAQTQTNAPLTVNLVEGTVALAVLAGLVGAAFFRKTSKGKVQPEPNQP